MTAIEDATSLFIEVSIWSAASPADAEELCRELGPGLVDEVDPPFELVRELGFHNGARSPDIGLVPPRPTVFFARAREPDGCQLVATGCVARDLVDGDAVDVVILLEPLAAPRPCPAALVCDDAECRDCVDDAECDDSNGCTVDGCDAGACEHVAEDPGCVPCTTDAECDDDDPCTVDGCDAGVCTFPPHVFPDPDADSDGHCLESCGGGCDDCDDENPLVNVDAARRCGAAVDHDCDGVIDDAQGCDPCVPNMTGTIRHITTLDLDASRGLYVVGADSETAQPGQLYAVSLTEVTVCTVERSGDVHDCSETPHGLASPLPPAVVGEHLLLLGKGLDNDLGVYSRSALDEGPLVTIGPWGTPLSMLVDHDTLFIATSPGRLWAVDIGHLPDVEEPTSWVLEDWPDACVDMARAGDYLLGLEPLAADGRLHVAAMTGPVPTKFATHFLDNGLPRDIDVYLDLGFLGVAQTQEGLSVIPLSLIARDDWSGVPQDEFHHAEFPAPGCDPYGADPCERAYRTFGLGPPASIVLAREIMGAAYKRTLYLVDLSPVSAEFDPMIGPSIDVPSETGDTWEDHLFVSGSLVFVATTTSSGQEVVELFELPCS
jgi:hypothetical protein